MNLLDRVVRYVSPRAAMKRLQARMALEYYDRGISKHFDGGSKGRRTKNWNPSNADAERTVQPQLATMRARSRDLIRNNAYAKRAKKGVVRNVIGTGIMAKMATEELQRLWDQWSFSTDCDFFGQNDFNGLQKLVMSEIFESGECLIRRRRMNEGALPMKLEVLEPDLIDDSKFHEAGGIQIRNGIEFDEHNRVVAYWIRTEHPGALRVRRGALQRSFRVPVEEIVHVFDKDRTGQVRGFPWLHAVMVNLNDLDEYEDAQLVRQKIAACFVGFVRDLDGPSTTALSGDEDGSLSEKFEPGAWETLPPGKTMEFANPPQVSGDYDPYVRRMLQKSAAGTDITYEIMTNDYSQVNFSSGRMGFVEFHRSVEDWRWNMFIPMFCEKVWKWFFEAASLAQEMPRSVDSPIWTPPRREMIDPEKEIRAMRSAIRNGLNTRSNALRELGFDPNITLNEWKEDAKAMDEAGLVFDSDPRFTSNAGIRQPHGEEEEPEDDAVGE